MKKTKRIILVAFTIVALVATLSITAFADIIDKGAYTFDTTTGVVTPKSQTITMERFPLPTDDGYIYHNQNFTTLGNESNFQFHITLKSSSGTDITFAFPTPDITKDYYLEFKGGDFEVRLLPLLRNDDGTWLYRLQTCNRTLEGNFSNFYEDFQAVITYQPTPQAQQSITDYTVSIRDRDYNDLASRYEQTREELNEANGALEQGNWLFGLFNGFFAGIANLLSTIGSFEIAGISLSVLIAVVVISVLAFFVIRLVL